MSIRDKYVFITTRNEDMQCVGIKEGPFAGVVYKYGKVSLGEENSNGTLPFRFEYDILDSNLIPRESFNDEFFKLIGDILVDIIDRQEGDIVEPINRENDVTNLITNEDYAKKVLPFIKKDYFDGREEKIIFEEITNFVDKYKKIPTGHALEIEVGERKDLTETEYKKIVDIIQTLSPTDVDFDWLVDTTEKFCKDKRLHLQCNRRRYQYYRW